MLKENQKAPDFKIKNDKNEHVKRSDFNGKTLVLYFYAKNNTPSCSNEAAGFRDLHTEFAKLNAEIVGVSIDPVQSHQNFRKRLDLPFQLLSDDGKKLAQLYDVWKEKSMYGKTYMGVERTTFVIDNEGVIRKIFPKVKVRNHPEKVLEFVKTIN